MIKITYETNRGTLKTITGEVIETPHIRNNKNWRVRNSRGDFWARERGWTSSSKKMLGITVSVEQAA